MVAFFFRPATCSLVVEPPSCNSLVKMDQDGPEADVLQSKLLPRKKRMNHKLHKHIYIYIPRTQMTLVLITNRPVLEG